MLGKIEQNKYVTEKDNEVDEKKNDEGKRRKRLEQVNYQMFPEDLMEQTNDLSGTNLM